jgi:hypothetical protein
MRTCRETSDRIKDPAWWIWRQGSESSFQQAANFGRYFFGLITATRSQIGEKHSCLFRYDKAFP